jgi:hypothetical protein
MLDELWSLGDKVESVQLLLLDFLVLQMGMVREIPLSLFDQFFYDSFLTGLLRKSTESQRFSCFNNEVFSTHYN